MFRHLKMDPDEDRQFQVSLFGHTWWGYDELSIFHVMLQQPAMAIITLYCLLSVEYQILDNLEIEVLLKFLSFVLLFWDVLG